MQRAPYQIFAIGGSQFPADDGDEFKALCHKAMPDHVAEIDKLFAAGMPDFAAIDALEKGNSWPTLRTMLKEEHKGSTLFTRRDFYKMGESIE